MFLIPEKYLKQANKIIFSYFWCYRRENIARKLLIRNINKGGLPFPDIKTRNVTYFKKKHIQNMQENLIQPFFWDIYLLLWYII